MKKRTQPYISQSLEDTRKFAQEFLMGISRGEKGEGATVVALQGDLGAGKTAFVKEIAKILGIKETVSSPTFVLERIYEIPKSTREQFNFSRLVHIDAYRLKDETELAVLDWDRILVDSDTMVFLEWPEIVPQAVPVNAKNISFRIVREGVREIVAES